MHPQSNKHQLLTPPRVPATQKGTIVSGIVASDNTSPVKNCVVTLKPRSTDVSAGRRVSE